MKTIERAVLEIQAGRLWRAKEILSGSLGNHSFSPALCRAYGEVLLRMGDLREAGKFLFLSGATEPQYAEAIQVYLTLSMSAHKKSFYASFPARARLSTLSEYPPSVAEELRRRGFQEDIRPASFLGEPGTLGHKMMHGLLFAAFLGALALLFIGIVRLIGYGAQTVYEWIRM